jgi:transposase
MVVPKNDITHKYKRIPTELTEEQFTEFILPNLSEGQSGPKCKISLHDIFNYVLKIIHTGMQWYQLPIKMADTGKPEIHYTRVFRIFQRWVGDGSLEKVFDNSVFTLHQNNLLDLSILHGDGSSTPAKKGGDMLGYNGHKHFKGEKVIAIVDRNVNVITPYTQAAGNKNESPLFFTALQSLKEMVSKIGASIQGSIMSLDGAYDSQKNRKAIFNSEMKPNIPENKRNRKKSKRGRKRIFCVKIFKERFQTIERLFAWEDKFKRLLLRFERKSKNHFCMKLIAFTMINIRHFCAT